ncbi:MARH5 ligase, partial [Acromyrmex heyeri]
YRESTKNNYITTQRLHSARLHGNELMSFCRDTMSDDNMPHISYGLDSRGRIVRIESGITRANIRRLPSIEEALRRLSTNLRSDRQTTDPNNEISDSQATAQIASLEEDSSQNAWDVTDYDLSVGPIFTDEASSPNQITSSVPSLTPEEDRRYCWVCFATDEDDATAAWVKPCHCRGTTKWVHQGCIQRWVDEKQKGHAGHAVACPQCNTEYIIVYPNMGEYFTHITHTHTHSSRQIDIHISTELCPFIAAGIVVGSIYWTAVTYGAVTVMQVVGHKDGLTMMEQADPLVLLVGLPTIPIMLVLGKMLRWEDQALNTSIQSEDIPPMNDPVSATRVLCGALLLPTIASLCGRIFFESISSNFQRTLLGGAAFITIKGAFKIYHKQQQYKRQCQRRVMDYTESNVALYKRQQDSESDRS